MSICGDNIIVDKEQCDDSNDVPFDGCYNCQYQCEIYCELCFFGVCQQCKQGFDLNIEGICQPICRDGIIIPYLEQCDEETDNCQYCKTVCPKNCNNCVQAFCLICTEGFNLLENQCIPNCGDSILVSEYEDCDDGNDEQFDGCYECKYQCNLKCQNCLQGICQDKCMDGEIMIDNQCQSICGNSIVTGDEECDDGNDEQYDGCFQCQQQCSLKCENCSNRICKDMCDYGEQMINYQCQSICGNQIVTGQEQCDDGNNIQYDGCYLCQYSCPLFCDYCEKGLCLECEEEFELKNQICMSTASCGDGNLGKEEECDDGNINSNDGCSSCKVEENWNCNLDQPSYCFYQINPFLILNYLNKTLEQIQYVSLGFSMEVYINNSNQLSQGMDVLIQNLNPENYNIIIHPIIEATSNLSNPEYIFSIEILTQLTNKPILEIHLNQQVFIVYFYLIFYHKNKYSDEQQQI